MGSRVQGSESRVQGSGSIPQDVERPPASVVPEHVAPGFGPEMHVNTLFMVYGLWFMVYVLCFMVYGLGVRGYGLWVMVKGLRV